MNILVQNTHPYGFYIIPAIAEITIFRPYIMGEENHNLSCVFFNKVCQISTLLFHLVHSSHHGAVGSASAWQT